MKFSLTAASVLALVANAVAQGGLTINTPASAVVCQPLLITWTGGTPPYFLVRMRTLLPGNQPSAAALKDFGTVTGTSLTWTVNFEANTSLGLTLRDSTGATAQSAAFTVQAGTDTSCVGKDPSSSAGGSTTAAGGTTAAGTTTPATTPAGTTTPATTPATSPATTAAGTSTTPTTSKATTSAASATTSKPATTPNAAVSNAVELGAAGLVAGVIALLA